MRDEKGRVVYVASHMTNAVSPIEAELKAIEWVLELATEKNWSCVKNQMVEEGTYSIIVPCCDMVLGQQVHADVVKIFSVSDVFLGTNFIRAYAGVGEMDAAMKAFYEMPKRDLVAWNALISCYSKAGMGGRSMRKVELHMLSFEAPKIRLLCSLSIETETMQVWLQLMEEAAEEADPSGLNCNHEAQHRYLTWRTEKMISILLCYRHHIPFINSS
ncbi:hypothetical protein FNV43_RR03592 [Rhamnella rubrinervis]|uniref:Pentatricopeptide repeat-containing protein n=1 Tax=Rhamnella rubrinervis TaxID=2594499 RepID=A0A8K0MPS4_9ROSA|nr:hypothetical protein FNV43_RR03592 [Rhamnella rubrinervis]